MYKGQYPTFSSSFRVTTRVVTKRKERVTAVDEVQLSGHVMSRQVPRLIMGSIVKIFPAFIIPFALFLA